MPELIELTDAFVKCRNRGGWGHQWDSFQPLQRNRGWGGVTISLRCERCTTERYDTIDAQGALVSRQYVYPEGYKLTGGVTTEDVRREVIRRLRFTRARKRSA